MWLGIAITVGLIVWAVGGLIALNPLPWHIRKYWDSPGAKELRIIQAIALLLIAAGVTIAFIAKDTFWYDLWPNMVSTGGVIWSIDELNRRRIAQQYKRGIIRQMASRSNEFALDAARIAKDEGWLQDGTFADAKLEGANLKMATLRGACLKRAFFMNAHFEDADLLGSDLERAILTIAHLEGANLMAANLERAELVATNLERANLTGALLPGATIMGANFNNAVLTGIQIPGARYDNATHWPEDFDPRLNGAVNWAELNEQKRQEWLERYRPEWQ